MKAFDTRSPNIFSRSIHFFDLEIFLLLFLLSKLAIFQYGHHWRRKFSSNQVRLKKIFPESK